MHFNSYFQCKAEFYVENLNFKGDVVTLIKAAIVQMEADGIYQWDNNDEFAYMRRNIIE